VKATDPVACALPRRLPGNQRRPLSSS
jgi:hypothetical protein